MIDKETDLVIRRILVALDASTHSLAALEEAASLAACMEAELMGLFVEDINLIRFASLPFARQICYPSGAEEPLDSVRMERELRVRAEQVRTALEAAAERARRPWSFRIVRGEVTPEILAAAAQADLLLLGKAGWSVVQPRGLGATALAVAAAAPGALLLAEHGVRVEGPVMTLYDGSAASQRLLRTAARLAVLRKQTLTVFLLGNSPELAERLQAEVKHMAPPPTKSLQIRVLSSADPRHLAESIRAEGGGLVVIGGSGPMTEEQAFRTLLRETDNPILLVR